MDAEPMAATGAARLAVRDPGRRPAHRRGRARHRPGRHLRGGREREREEHPRRGVRGRVSAGRRRDALCRRPGPGSERGGFAAGLPPEGADEPHGLTPASSCERRRCMPTSRRSTKTRGRPGHGAESGSNVNPTEDRSSPSSGTARRGRRVLPRRAGGRASFRSCLGLIALFDAMRREGSQLVVATHSPLLVSLPDATLQEVGEWGLRRVAGFEELDLVGEWRSFLDAPPRFFKHLLDD